MMETNSAKPQSMIETTDALEAVSACQSMKNFLFVLILVGLVLTQGVFWMNYFGLISRDECLGPCQNQCPAILREEPQANAQGNTAIVYLTATTEITPPAEVVDTEPAKSIEDTIDDIVESANQPKPEEVVVLEKETDHFPAEIPTEHASPEMLEPAEPAEESEASLEEILKDKMNLFRISDSFAKILVAICNYIILIATVLYCLCLLICLKISLAGRLGGINHITRAFFVSLFLLVVLIPWQTVLPGVLIGTLWRPCAIWCQCWAQADSSVFWEVVMYLRFTGLWLLAIWLLLLTQIRSARWARATLRRMGVVR